MTSQPAPAKDQTASPATRGAMLDRLKRYGPQSASTLAEALGVTAMAVRLHLYGLEEEGLVTTEGAPAAAAASGQKPRGRPVKNWALTDAAATVFPDAHQGLALHLINAVEGLFGQDGLDKVIARHGEKQLDTYAKNLVGAKTLGVRLKRLAKTRSEEGYMAEVIRDGDGWLFIENHCPICSAAKTCTRLCANELAVFQEVLGPKAKVERTEHIIQGARRCAYQVSGR